MCNLLGGQEPLHTWATSILEEMSCTQEGFGRAGGDPVPSWARERAGN